MTVLVVEKALPAEKPVSALHKLPVAGSVNAPPPALTRIGVGAPVEPEAVIVAPVPVSGSNVPSRAAPMVFVRPIVALGMPAASVTLRVATAPSAMRFEFWPTRRQVKALAVAAQDVVLPAVTDWAFTETMLPEGYVIVHWMPAGGLPPEAKSEQ